MHRIRIHLMVIQYRRKKLVGFEKVALKAGESANVDIHVDASALEVWDVNAGEYVVEDGTYQLYAAHSSDLKGENVLSKKVKYPEVHSATLILQKN